MRSRSLFSVRSVVFGGLALAAIVSFFVLQPATPKDRSTEISTAIVEDSLNAKSSSSAPQQQVVNGWTARDLLEIDAKIANDQAQAESDRNLQLSVLVLIGVLAICWYGLSATLETTPGEPEPRSEGLGDTLGARHSASAPPAPSAPSAPTAPPGSGSPPARGV